MNKAYIFSRQDFNKAMEDSHITCAAELPDHVAVISICEPNDSYHYFEESPNVLNIDFWDVTEESAKIYQVKPLSIEKASLIYRFIENHIGKDFYIHCKAGMSRSQAVGRYLEDCYGYKVVTNIRPFPNPHVLKILKDLYNQCN